MAFADRPAVQVRVAGPSLNRVSPGWMPSVNTRAPDAPLSDSAGEGINRAVSKAIFPAVSSFAAA